MSKQYRITGTAASEIAASVETGIRDGRLAPGQAMPTVRSLADELGVAPGTVAAAYRALAGRGVTEGRGRSGTFVRSRPPVAARSLAAAVDPGVTDLADGQPDPRLLPPLDVVSLGGHAAAPQATVLPAVLDIARSRFAADNVPSRAVTLANGGLDAIRRVLLAHLRPGDTVAVEDPGWPNLLDLLAALGLRAHPVALDEHGPRPDELDAALRSKVSAVVVTSRAQNPTGASVTRARARALRRILANVPATLVIEDDHAADLAAVEVYPLARATDSWAFVRSTSKPYGPDLRLAAVAGDAATISRVEGRMRVESGWVSTVLQRLVLALWTSPQAEAAVTAAGRTYDRRRSRLIAELARHDIAAIGATGLNIWVPVPDETAAVTGLLRAGWAVAPGSRFRISSSPGIRITVSGLTDATIPTLARDVAAALEVPTSVNRSA